MWDSRISCALLVLLLVPPAPLSAQKISDKDTHTTTQSSYSLQTFVVGAAGTAASSSGKKTTGTLGQSTPIGLGSAGEKVLNAGFWKGYLGVLSAFFPALPEIFNNALHQNFPNPFNPLTTIQYSVAKRSPVEISIYNVQGRKVRTLVNDYKSAGRYQVFWDGKNDKGEQAASGIYFYRLKVGAYHAVKKMLLLK